MHQLIIFLITVCIFHAGYSVEIPTPKNIDAPALDSSHTIFTKILNNVASPVGVNYKTLRDKQSTQLDTYRWQLAHSTLPSAKAERMAFYINAYNAFTLALVLHLLPEDSQTWDTWSVRKQRGFWKNYTFEVAGEQLSLDSIEHKILRPMGDPRIHFAVNCASVSCPTLRHEAYTGKKLEQQLEDQAQAFLKSPQHLRIENGTLYCNAILDWFGKDFKAHGGVATYIKMHCPQETVQTYFKSHQRIRFLDYNWNLNLDATAPAQPQPAP